MKDKHFTEEQDIRILQEAESGLSVTDVCRKHHRSEQSFYRRKAKLCALTRQFQVWFAAQAKKISPLVSKSLRAARLKEDNVLSCHP